MRLRVSRTGVVAISGEVRRLQIAAGPYRRRGGAGESTPQRKAGNDWSVYLPSCLAPSNSSSQLFFPPNPDL